MVGGFGIISSDALGGLTTILSRIYDANPPALSLVPGALPPDIDKPLEIPESLPATTEPSKQERFTFTPIYDLLT